VGFLITRNIWGAVMGAIVGHMFDENAGFRYANSPYATAARAAAGGSSQASISEVFFRTTFEFMGHVAKSDGHVSEAEIDAARGLMQELRLGANEINAAIAYFRFGKSPAYDAGAASSCCAVRACGMTYCAPSWSCNCGRPLPATACSFPRAAS
jgi:DnaJ like chaperone protein